MSQEDINVLARLWIKTQGEVGKVTHADCAEFELAFEKYSNDHPHLKEVFPHEPARKANLTTCVRAVARQQCIDACSKDVPEEDD